MCSSEGYNGGHMNKDFQYSDEYKELTEHEQGLLDTLAEILFEVQYAKMGEKTQARRDAALTILKAFEKACKD